MRGTSSASPPSLVCTGCEQEVPLARSDAPLVCHACGRTYPHDNGVLLLGHTDGQEDYPQEAYELLAAVETKHFWFGARNRVILSTLGEAIGPLVGRYALDVGCGTGFVLSALERAGMACYGLDAYMAGLRLARERTRAALLCTSGSEVPFRRQFDAVLLCDVIEHTSDDVGVVRAAGGALHDSGALVVTVPADPRLWTTVDEISGHKRRYTKTALVQAMESAGLRVRTARYFNSLLLPAELMRRWLLGRHPAPETEADRVRLLRRALQVPPRPVNRLLALATSLDLRLQSLSLPFGASLIAVGSRG